MKFTSQPAEGQEQPEPVTFDFELDDAKFTCHLASDAVSVLEWSELIGGASEMDADDSPETAAYVGRFFRLTLGPDYRRFKAHLRANKTGNDVLFRIMNGVTQEMERLVTEAAERPTQPSSSSSGGATAADERRLRIISLAAESDFQLAEPPPPGTEFPEPGTGLEREPIPSQIKELGPQKRGKKQSA